MSRKESKVGGDPVEGTGSPAQEPDDQEREEVFEFPNSEMGRESDVRSTSDRQASVSRQKQGCGSGAISSRTHKKMTYSLTDGQRRMAQKPKKAKSRKPQGVKTLVSGRTEPGSVSGTGKGRGTARLFPDPVCQPEHVDLPEDTSGFDDSEDENVGGAQPLSRSPMENKSDQLALPMVTPPNESLIPGDITSLVTKVSVMTQDLSAVPDSAWPSSSTPVQQVVKATQSFDLSAEVYVVTEPERITANTSGGQTQAPSCMSLGTQVDRDLSHAEGSSLTLPQGTDDNPGPCLEINPAKLVAEIVFHMHAQLQLARSYTLSGARVAPLSDEDVVMFGQWIDKVGLDNLPQVQPKQFACTGVRAFVQALKGAQIHLVHSEDCDSDTSVMDTSHDSFPQGCHSSNPLNLEAGDPSDLEDGETIDRSHPSEPMDQSDTLGHGVQPTGNVASNAMAALGRMSNF